MSEVSLTAFVLRDKHVEWTALQRRKHRMEIVQQKNVELDWPESVTDYRSDEAAAFLKTKLPPFSGRLGIVVPSDRVLMRVIEFPSIDAEELYGMAELQVDKFSPFPSDQMALAIEVLNQTADSSRVLIAAVQHEYINQYGEFLMKTGLYPESVDVDVLAWWRLIRDSGKLSGEGQEIIIIHDDHCAQLLITQQGVPVMIRALDPDLDMHRPSTAVDIAQEIEYTLMTMEGTWGSSATSGMMLWVRGHAAVEVVDALRQACGHDIVTASLDDLPPLSEGLSRRMASTDGGRLDLAPPAWRSGIQSRKFQRKAVVVAASAFGIWLVMMLGLWSWSNLQKNKLAQAQEDITRLQTEVEAVRELRRQVESLQQYADRSYSGLECLREICVLIPQGVDITSITYNKESQVNMRGESDSDRPINDFIASLEKSGIFTSVVTENISTQVRNGRNRSMFRITMMLPGIKKEQEPGT